MRTDRGAVRIEVPRDRDASFEPILIPKHERRFRGFDERIIALYARGISIREIQAFIAEHAAPRSSTTSSARSRVCKPLVPEGLAVGKERVRRLMQQHGIRARGKRKFKATTDSAHTLPVAPNPLGREFSAVSPNAVWPSDITYVATDEG